MFERLFQLDIVAAGTPSDGPYDFAVVFGDRQPDFRVAQRLGIPYVLIENDVHTMRSECESDDERDMVEGAAAMIVTSEGYIPHLAERYTLPDIVESIHLRPLMSDITFRSLPKLEGQHIAYAGGIFTKTAIGDAWGYRVLYEPFAALIDCGWTVHIYPAGTCQGNAATYPDELGPQCIVHDQVAPHMLFRELSQYQAGFHGWGTTGAQNFVHHCVPNKAYEYLGAGIPTLGYNAGPVADIYVGGGWGYHHAKDWKYTTRKVLGMEIDQDVRFAQTMEQDWPKFERIARTMTDSV
jgi:hypothetical protein